MILTIISFNELPTGSQADWVQAIASIIAAVGLVVTLLLQWKSAKDQREALSIEKNKYIREILPVFNILSEEEIKIDDGLLMKMNLKLTNADAYNLVCKADGNPSIRFYPQSQSILNKDSILEILGRYERDVLGGIIILNSKGRILYNDIDGRSYQQDIYFNEGFREGPKLI